MDVKKIFMTLVIVVACVMIGALLLNILLPNAATALVDSVETMLYKATGMEFDFNGNTKGGKAGTTGTMKSDGSGSNSEKAGKSVDGFN